MSQNLNVVTHFFVQKCTHWDVVIVCCEKDQKLFQDELTNTYFCGNCQILVNMKNEKYDEIGKEASFTTESISRSSANGNSRASNSA